MLAGLLLEHLASIDPKLGVGEVSGNQDWNRGAAPLCVFRQGDLEAIVECLAYQVGAATAGGTQVGAVEYQVFVTCDAIGNRYIAGERLENRGVALAGFHVYRFAAAHCVQGARLFDELEQVDAFNLAVTKGKIGSAVQAFFDLRGVKSLAGQLEGDVASAGVVVEQLHIFKQRADLYAFQFFIEFELRGLAAYVHHGLAAVTAAVKLGLIGAKGNDAIFCVELNLRILRAQVKGFEILNTEAAFHVQAAQGGQRQFGRWGRRGSWFVGLAVLGGGLAGAEIAVEIDFVERQIEAQRGTREVVNIQVSGKAAVVEFKIYFGEFDCVRCGGQAALQRNLDRRGFVARQFETKTQI